MRRGKGSSGEYTDTAGVDGEEPGEVKVLAVGVIAGAAMVVVLAEEVGIGGGGGGGVLAVAEEEVDPEKRFRMDMGIIVSQEECLFIRRECVVCVALLQESMYSEVGLIGNATRPPWLDEPTTGQTEEYWLCRPMYIVFFHFLSGCLQLVF